MNLDPGPAPTNATYSTINGFKVGWTNGAYPTIAYSSLYRFASYSSSGLNKLSNYTSYWSSPSGAALQKHEIDVLERGDLTLRDCDLMCGSDAIAQFTSPSHDSLLANNTNWEQRRNQNVEGIFTTRSFDVRSFLDTSMFGPQSSRAGGLKNFPSCLLGCSCDANVGELQVSNNCANWCDSADEATITGTSGTSDWWKIGNAQILNDTNNAYYKYASVFQQITDVSSRLVLGKTHRNTDTSIYLVPMPKLNQTLFPYNVSVCVAACEARGVCGPTASPTEAPTADPINSGNVLTLSVAVVAALMSQWIY